MDKIFHTRITVGTYVVNTGSRHGEWTLEAFRESLCDVETAEHAQAAQQLKGREPD